MTCSNVSLVDAPNTQYHYDKKQFGLLKNYVFTHILKNYQIEALERIHSQRGLLVSHDMGMGKTILAIALIVLYVAKKKLCRDFLPARPLEPALVIVSSTLFDNWKSQIEKFNMMLGPFSEHRVNCTTFTAKSSAQKILSWRTSESFVDIILVSYDILRDKTQGPSHIDKFLKDEARNKTKWSILILDESHKIKNVTSKRFNSCLKLRKKISPHYIMLLSGTPIQNKISELGPQLSVLFPTKFNKKWLEKFAFIAECSTNLIKKLVLDSTQHPGMPSLDLGEERVDESYEEDSDIDDEAVSSEVENLSLFLGDVTTLTREDIEAKSLTYLLGVVRRYLLKRSIHDEDIQLLSEIPAPVYLELPWKMDPVQKALYEKVSCEMLSKKSNRITYLQRLRYLSDHPYALDQFTTIIDSLGGQYREVCGRSKIFALVSDVVRVLKVDQESKALIFVVNLVVGQEISRWLKEELFSLGLIKEDESIEFVHGQLSIPERNDKIKQCREGDRFCDRVLILSSVGSEGLCLTEFNHVFSFDLPWSPSEWQQQIARAYRLGQTKQVTITTLVNQEDPPLTFCLDRYFKRLFSIKECMIKALFSSKEGVIENFVALQESSDENIEDVIAKEIVRREEGLLSYYDETKEDGDIVKKRKVEEVQDIPLDLDVLRQSFTTYLETSYKRTSSSQSSCSLMQSLNSVRLLLNSNVSSEEQPTEIAPYVPIKLQKLELDISEEIVLDPIFLQKERDQLDFKKKHNILYSEEKRLQICSEALFYYEMIEKQDLSLDAKAILLEKSRLLFSLSLENQTLNDYIEYNYVMKFLYHLPLLYNQQSFLIPDSQGTYLRGGRYYRKEQKKILDDSSLTNLKELITRLYRCYTQNGNQEAGLKLVLKARQASQFSLSNHDVLKKCENIISNLVFDFYKDAFSFLRKEDYDSGVFDEYASSFAADLRLNHFIHAEFLFCLACSLKSREAAEMIKVQFLYQRSFELLQYVIDPNALPKVLLYRAYMKCYGLGCLQDLSSAQRDCLEVLNILGFSDSFLETYKEELTIKHSSDTNMFSTLDQLLRRGGELSLNEKFFINHQVFKENQKEKERYETAVYGDKIALIHRSCGLLSHIYCSLGDFSSAQTYDAWESDLSIFNKSRYHLPFLQTQ